MEPVGIVMIRLLKHNALIRNILKALVLLTMAFNVGNVVVNGNLISATLAVTFFIFYFFINHASIK